MAVFLRKRSIAPAEVQVAIIPQYQGGSARRPRIVMGQHELAYVSKGSIGAVVQHALAMQRPKGRKPAPRNWADKGRKPGPCFVRTGETRSEDSAMSHAWHKAQERKASVR